MKDLISTHLSIEQVNTGFDMMWRNEGIARWSCLKCPAVSEAPEA